MSSGFITETEAEEIRKKRQEEWEKVRKPDEPLDRPEEVIDCRSLYERLQEQKQKKDLEYEEAHKLKNMIKGLDDDEIDFLELVDRTKLAADRKKEIEEERELNDYRNRVATLQEKNYEERLQAEISVSKPKSNLSNGRITQQKLLKGIVVKKNEGVKRKASDSFEENLSDNNKKILISKEVNEKVPNQEEKTNTNTTIIDAKGEPKVTSPKDLRTDASSIGIAVPNSSLKCIAILPGLGCYESGSSSDENSSDSELECYKTKKLDILGRKIEEKQKESC